MRTLAVASACLALAACVGPEIQSPVHFLPTRAPTDATLVVRRVAMPDRLVVVAPSPQYAMLSPSSTGTQILAEVQDGLAHDVDAARVGATVVEERDVGPAGAGAHAFLLRWSVVSYASAIDFPVGEIVGWTVLGSLTAGLGCIPLAGTRVGTEHRLAVEVELFDVRAARVHAVPSPDTGELVDAYDTSGLRPLLRRVVHVAMRSGVGLGGVGGGTALDFVEAEAHELVLRVLAETEGPLADAIRHAEAAPPVPPAFALPPPVVVPGVAPLPGVPPTSPGAAPMPADAAVSALDGPPPNTAPPPDAAVSATVDSVPQPPRDDVTRT